MEVKTLATMICTITVVLVKGKKWSIVFTIMPLSIVFENVLWDGLNKICTLYLPKGPKCCVDNLTCLMSLLHLHL